MGKQDRGFASMDPEKQRAIASKGGKAAHKKGRAREWTVEEAREAGRKGGAASHKTPKGVTESTAAVEARMDETAKDQDKAIA